MKFDFRITYPAASGLSWTDGSNHVLAWQATPDATSVDISLVDDKNETVSQLGSYDASKGVTGEKPISLQGHPTGFYHFEFTVKSASSQCKLSSEQVQINGASQSTSATSHSDAPPSDEELDSIFDSLSNDHANQEWTSEAHDDNGPASTAGVTPTWTSHDDVQDNTWHEDDVNDLVDALGNHPNDGATQENAWHEDDVQDDTWHEDDVNDLVDALGNHPNDGATQENAWHEDDVQDDTWHEDDVSDLVDALGNHPNNGWTSHADDVQTNTDSTEPKTFDDLIGSLDQPYDKYLENNNATEGQNLNVHKNAADDESSGASPTTTTNSDLDATLDDIFAKLAGSGSTDSTSHDNVAAVDDHHWHSNDGTYFTDEVHEVESTTDNSHSNDAEWQEDDATVPATNSNDKHWNSDDNSYFTDELHQDDSTTDRAHSNAAEWQEDDATVPATNSNDKHWNSDDNSYFTDEVHQDDSTTDRAHSNAAEWHEDDATAPATSTPAATAGKFWHTDEANYFTDELQGDQTHASSSSAPHTNAAEWHEDVAESWNGDGVNHVNEAHADDSADRWFTDVHNEENHANEAVEENLSNEHADDAAKWFTDVHNEENHTNEDLEGLVEDLSNAHANDAPATDRWFTDVHNEETHANEAVEENLSNEHADDAAKWFTDVHNEENHANEAVEENLSNEHADDAAKWSTDVHNEENHANEAVEENLSNEHADDASKWFTDVHNEENHTNEDLEGLVEDLSNEHANDAPTTDRWFTDVHNEETHANEAVEVPTVAAEHADDADKWFTDVHNDDSVPAWSSE
ncbi:unnamed protein product [Umbelopsis sp. WA50703]